MFCSGFSCSLFLLRPLIAILAMKSAIIWSLDSEFWVHGALTVIIISAEGISRRSNSAKSMTDHPWRTSLICRSSLGRRMRRRLNETLSTSHTASWRAPWGWPLAKWILAVSGCCHGNTEQRHETDNPGSPAVHNQTQPPHHLPTSNISSPSVAWFHQAAFAAQKGDEFGFVEF